MSQILRRAFFPARGAIFCAGGDSTPIVASLALFEERVRALFSFMRAKLEEMGVALRAATERPKKET